MEEKEGFWGKVKKKITKKVVITLVCILVFATLVFTARNIIQKAIDETIVYVMNAARLMTLFDEDENKEVEIYNIDTSVGVDGCKLRPKTGVYPGTSGSSGVATSRGTLPDGVPTIREMLDFEIKMYEHAKTKYSSITDKMGDKHSDGTGTAHIFSLLDKTNGASFISLHNNKSLGHTDKAAGKHGQKLVKDSDYPYSYGTLDFNDNRQTFSDSGNGKAWKGCSKPAGQYMKEAYDANISKVRTYGRYDKLSLGYTAGDVQKKWRDGGSKSSNGLAQFDCPDGVTRLGAVFKANIGYYLYGVPLSAGDYIDVYYEDGQVDHYVMQDSKGQETESFVMHPTGCSIEHYIVTNKSSGNVLDLIPDRKGVGVTGFVKVGNLLNDPTCTGTYTITWKDGQPGTGGATVTPPSGGTPVPEGTSPETLPDGTEIPPGYAFLDSNGQPCTPDGSTPTTGGGGSWADNFGAVPGRRTIKNYLQHALSAMGRVTYMYGGGQGNGPNYVIGFDKLLPTYKDYHDRNIENKEKFKNNRGLDCCGYVKWIVYNTFHTEEGKHDTDGGVASGYDNSLANKGYGKIVYKDKNWSSVDLKPGDIVSSGPHIWTIIGKSENGGYVMIHSSQTGELVRLGGTSGTGAVNTAKKYNDIVNTASTEVMGNTPVDWFPEGKGQGSGKFTRGGDSYSNKSTEIFRWNYDSTGLEDPDGILNMSAEQILELLIGDGRRTPENTTSSGSTGKKVFIDPGHGPGTFNDAQMTAAGYSKNSSGAWGEWRHYDSTGKVGTNCNNCGKDASHACWYPFANALRPEHLEPVLTMNIANELVPILQSRGYEVAVSRNSSEHPSIGKRAKDAYDFGAHIQVCIHTNAGGGSGIAYCSPAGGGYGSNSYKTSDWQSKSLDLNKKILDKVKAKTTLGLYNGGVINNYGYLILYEKASCPTAYLELGFHDNASDLAKIKAETKQIAEGIADGIDAYFK